MMESHTNRVEKPDLLDQVAVVTGGARGLGRTIMEMLAARGAKAVSLDLQASHEVVESIVSAGGEAAGLSADLTDETQVENAFEEIVGRYGRIDILVNNAGLYQVERRPFWEIDLAEWEKLLTVNIRSVFLCSKAVSKPMREAKRGRIVNITSDCISFGMPNLMHYVAAKTAVVGMTRSMSRELGSYGICVNAIAPGLVSTPSAFDSIGEEVMQQVIAEQCIEKPIMAEDVARSVAYLCSEAGNLITGQTLFVNGGMNNSGI